MTRLDPAYPFGAVLIGTLLVVVGIALSWTVRRALATVLRFDRHDRVDAITLSFVSHLAVLMIWLLLLTVYVHVVPALNRLGAAMLAGVSLVSIIVGFAAQTTLGNLVAGVSLVLYKPFRRGDRVQIATPTKDGFEVGEVEDISLGFTVIVTDDGRRIIVANGTMAQQTVVKLPPETGAEAASTPPA